MCNNCNQNKCTGCNQTVYQSVHICNECPPEDCSCPIKDLSTDCSTYTGDDIKDGAITVVPKNTILSNALQLIVAYIRTAVDAVASNFTIINTGVGASIYSGISLIGEKKLRKLKSSDSSVTITEGADDIDITVVTGASQDNFVRQLIINSNDLPVDYTEQDICDYILALPSGQRTILETDSKWNVIILEASS